MDDNRFADQVAQNMVQISGVDFEKQSSTVCDRCRDLLERPLSRHTISVVNLQATSSQCCLCALLLHATLSRKWRSETRTLEAVLKRDGSKITFDAAGEKKRVLSIGQMPGKWPRLSFRYCMPAFGGLRTDVVAVCRSRFRCPPQQHPDLFATACRIRYSGPRRASSTMASRLRCKPSRVLVSSSR